MERQAEEIFAHLDELGDGSMLEGVLRGVEEGWFQGEIADAAYELERKLNAGRHVVVGVNALHSRATTSRRREIAAHRPRGRGGAAAAGSRR